MFERLRRKRRDGELSDGELHRAALKGSGEAMAAIYRRHGGLIYRFTLQMSRNETVAEEITQEVFLALLTQMDRFDATRGALSTWLCGIARRQLWKYLERSGNANHGDFEDESAEDLEAPRSGASSCTSRLHGLAHFSITLIVVVATVALRSGRYMSSTVAPGSA